MNKLLPSDSDNYKTHDEKISIPPQQAASTSVCILTSQPCSNGPVQCTSSSTIFQQEFISSSRSSELIVTSSYNTYCSSINNSCKDSEGSTHFEPTPTTSSSSSLIDDRPSTSAIENLSVSETTKLKFSKLSFSARPSTLAKLRRITSYHPRILRKLGITLINVKNKKSDETLVQSLHLPRRLSPSPPPPPPRKSISNFKSPLRTEAKTSPASKSDRSQPVRVMSRNTPNSMPDASGALKPPSTPDTPQSRPTVSTEAANTNSNSNLCQESPLLVNLLSNNTPQQSMMQPHPSTPQTPRYPPPTSSFMPQQPGMRPTGMQPMQPSHPMQAQQQQIVYTQGHPSGGPSMMPPSIQSPMHNPYGMPVGAPGPMHMNRPPMPQHMMATPTTPGAHPMPVMGHPPPQMVQQMPPHPGAMAMMPGVMNESPPPKAKRKRPTKKEKEQQKQMQQGMLAAQGMMPGHQQQMTPQEYYMLQQQQRVPPVNMHMPQGMQPRAMGYPPQYPPAGYPQEQASTSMMAQGHQFQQHGYPTRGVQQPQQQWHNSNTPAHMGAQGQVMSEFHQQQHQHQMAAHQQQLMQQQAQQQQQQQHQMGQAVHPPSQQPIEQQQQQPHTPLPPQTPTSAATAGTHHQYPTSSPAFAVQQQQQQQAQTPQDKLRMPPPVYSPQFAPNRTFMAQTPPAYPQGAGTPQQNALQQQQHQQPQTPQSGRVSGHGVCGGQSTPQQQTADFSSLSDGMDFSGNDVDDLMATISGGDADEFDLDSIEPTVQSNPMSSPPQQPMILARQQQQQPPQGTPQHFPPQSPAHGYPPQMAFSAQSPNVNGPNGPFQHFQSPQQQQISTPPGYMQHPPMYQGQTQMMSQQSTPNTPTEVESPNSAGGKKGQAQQKKAAAANRNTNINSTIDAVLEMVNSKNVDEVGDIFAATQEANQKYANDVSIPQKPSPEKKVKKEPSVDANKKHSNGGTVHQMQPTMMLHHHTSMQEQKMVYNTNGGSSVYMNEDYGSGQAYAHFNGHMANHVVEGQLSVTQNVFTPPPGMEARAEMTFKMPDNIMQQHPNMPMTIMKDEPPPKKPKKVRKKPELSKEANQPKEENVPFFTSETTNG